jgi:aspartate-semialdehyde dehydrogenase
MADAGLSIAVVGPAGLAGGEILEVLAERQFPMRSVRLLGTMRTAGADVERGGVQQKIELISPNSFDGVDLAFFATGIGVADEWVPAAVAAGARVIDLSSRFRLDETVPLVVPEVNADTLSALRESSIAACPSPIVVGLSVVLAPLAQAVGLRRIVVSTYQAVAGAGRHAVESLSRETIELLRDGTPRRRHFPRRIAFNCIPQVGTIEPEGDTTYEREVLAETRKVLADPSLALSVSAVRVPVFFGHAATVHLETDAPLPAEDAARVLREAPGVVLHEGDPDLYPTPVEIVGSAATHVGRLRDDPIAEQGLAFWLTLDNVRKGTALNAVEIAEIIARDHL